MLSGPRALLWPQLQFISCDTRLCNAFGDCYHKPLLSTVSYLTGHEGDQ